MARSKRNVIVHNLSGKVGDLVLFRQRHGKTIMGKIPIHNGKTTPKQKAVRETFLKAVHYAKASLKDPSLVELYSKKAGGGITPFNLAVTDFCKAPVIDDISTAAYTGAAGSQIIVQATDDTKVTGVKVSITGGNGQLVEEAPAIQDPETGYWLYTATIANATMAGSKIIVTAKDIPGNATSAEKVL